MSKNQFPVLVFKNNGPHQRAGGSYDHKLVEDQDSLEGALAAGWFATLPEAIAAETAPTSATTASTEPTAAKVAPAKGSAKVAPAQPWAKG